MIQFNCPKCRGTLSVADDNAGRHTWCRTCQRVVMVPAALANAPAASAPPEERTRRADTTNLASLQAETDRLRGALEDARAEHNKSTQSKSQQLDATQHDLESVRAERDELAHDLDDQQTRAIKLEQALEQAEQSASESNAEIQNLEAKLASAASTPAVAAPLADDRDLAWEREKATLDTELGEIRNTLAQRDRELNELRRTAEDTDALRAKTDALETAARERDSLRTQLQTLNEKAENEAAVLAALQERLRDAEANNTTLTQQIQEAGESARSFATEQQTEELNALRTQLDAAQSTTAADQSALADLQEKLWNAESENTSLNDRIRDLENQSADQGSLEEKTAAHDVLQLEVTALRERLEAATEAGSDGQTAMANLEEKLRNSESHAAELNAQISELDALRQQAATLDEVQRDAANLREQLQHANEAGSNDRNSLTGLQEKLQHADSQIAELNGRVADLTNQVSEIESLRQQSETLEETQRDAASLRERLDAACTAQSDAEARANSLDAERVNLVESLEATARRADTAEERLQQADTDLADRNTDLTKQDSLLAETRLDLETARAETETLRTSLAEQTAAVPETADTTGLEAELQEARAQLERKADEINSLSAELESERARANTAEAHAAMPHEEFADNAEPPALQPAETVSNSTADEQESSDEEPPSEEDDMLDALMRFLGRQ